MTDLELIRESVAKHAAKILDANDRIWDYAELAFHEHKSRIVLDDSHPSPFIGDGAVKIGTVDYTPLVLHDSLMPPLP